MSIKPICLSLAIPLHTSEHELMDIVDHEDHVTGSAVRGEIHRQGLMHRSVHVLVVDANAKVLLQRRSMQKDQCGGMWDTACAGHVESGCGYDESAHRELQEELGIELEQPLTSLFKLPPTVGNGHEFAMVYRIVNGGPFVVAEDEIDELRWFNPEELDQWVAGVLPENVKTELTTGFVEIWQRYRTMHNAFPNAGDSLNTNDFDYTLPVELIAQHPPDKRSGGRLLCLDGQLRHKRIEDLPELLREGDLLVMNNTRVFPARLFGKKATGGKVELLVEKIIDDCLALCLCKSSKSPKPGTKLKFESGHTATVEGREEDLFIVRFDLQVPLIDYMQEHGSLPLPPYIERTADADDRDRYQTVFASSTGAIAAPTAGLHFDAELIERCKAAGVETGFVTLHVGAGTFQPVRTDNMAEHKMHAEWLCVDQKICDQISATKKRGGRVVAIGTTVVRSLETAAQSGVLKPFEGDTRLFIKPGDSFNVIDGLLTNFHLPKSTLLMLVCAFGGMQRVMQSYQVAVEDAYRFFSYGDAMLLWPRNNSNEIL